MIFAWCSHGRFVTLLVRSAVHRLRNHLRFCYGGGVERRFAPRNLNRQPGKIDDAAVPAVAREVMRGAHENAIHRTRLDAQSAEHALGIVDRKAGNLKALAVLYSLLANVDAIDGASLSTLIAGNARR